MFHLLSQLVALVRIYSSPNHPLFDPSHPVYIMTVKDNYITDNIGVVIIGQFK